MGPIVNHGFLNVRTYVKYKNEAGVHFLNSWQPNILEHFTVPYIYGFPYKLGSINYRNTGQTFIGKVQPRDKSSLLSFKAKLTVPSRVQRSRKDSLEEFLMERYVAFMAYPKKRKKFYIHHPPWKQKTVPVRFEEINFMSSQYKWFADTSFVQANFTPGIKNIWVGWPQSLD